LESPFTRYSSREYKVNYFYSNEKDWIRALDMSVEDVRHHTHPIDSVSTNLASKIKNKQNKNKIKDKSKRLLLKSQNNKGKKKRKRDESFFF
jgi:hypothetical protein